MPQVQVKVTASQRKALEKFSRASASPRGAEIRTDVARTLFDRGYVEGLGNRPFNAGYATLKITPLGRRVLEAQYSGGWMLT